MNNPVDKAAAPEILHLDYPAFIDAYGKGEVIVNFERKAAAKFLSARMLLPLFMLPILGIGVSLALIGWLWTGLAVIGLAILNTLRGNRGKKD